MITKPPRVSFENNIISIVWHIKYERYFNDYCHEWWHVYSWRGFGIWFDVENIKKVGKIHTFYDGNILDEYYFYGFVYSTFDFYDAEKIPIGKNGRPITGYDTGRYSTVVAKLRSFFSKFNRR